MVMGFESSTSFISTVLVLAAIAGILIYGYMEYQVRMLRTTATKLASGLLFTSRFLTVGTRNASQEVVVNAPMGRQALEAAMADLSHQPRTALAVVLPAVGLACQVKVDSLDKAATTSDRCTITFTAPDAARLQALGLPAAPGTVVVVDGVPLPVARAFQSFAAQMGLWVERVEQRIHLEREAARRKAEEAVAAQAAAEKTALRATAQAAKTQDDYSTPVSDEERQARVDKQVSALRNAAGFKGSSSEISTDPGGKIQWYVDLEPGGRVILQSGSRSFHGSLKGAKVTTLTGELEVGVRDALWTEEEPVLSHFNILAGAKPEIRMAWKERLEILIRSLR